MSALKKIEARHSGWHWCGRDTGEPPCDAVKLARALDALYTFPGVRELLAPNDSIGSIAAQVERTLEEVAGE